jgi:hypothetical protein
VKSPPTPGVGDHVHPSLGDDTGTAIAAPPGGATAARGAWRRARYGSILTSPVAWASTASRRHGTVK